MWLLPAFSRVASFAVRTFYRFEVDGRQVPPFGPVLLVANHPNSLIDPAAVAAVARRPVRFLAKAPLFSDPLVGWLVRGSGAVPVYRRSDDPALMDRNDETFQAVHAALAESAAVGIFPEGISHSDPALAPLKTGAARIALAAGERIGGAFPIIPIGLSFHDKPIFRSRALALTGPPVAWDDLAGRSEDDPEAVRELTTRIEAALHAVTINLERREDAALVDVAEAIYAAEYPTDPAPGSRIGRMREITEGLATLRRAGDERWAALAREVRGHARTLRVLGMRPHELRPATNAGEAVRWSLEQSLLLRLEVPLAVLGAAAYYLPYRVTGWVESRARPEHDVRATFKLLVGTVLHLAWTLLLALLVGWRFGWGWGLLALILLPPLGLLALRVLERWHSAAGEAWRFVLRTRRGPRVRTLRERQRAIAEQLETLRVRVRR